VSRERSILVRVQGSPSALELYRDIESARRRARKALPGDRVDVVRFESLCSQLERKGIEAVREGAEKLEGPIANRLGLSARGKGDLEDLSAEAASSVRSWLAAGDLAVEVSDPLGFGPTHREEAKAVEVPVAERWQAPDGEEGRRAVARRFQQQMARVIEGAPDAKIAPSGVSNSVLTEGLREYAAGSAGERVDAPVHYRDGSSGRVFPLRALGFAEMSSSSRVLRFALLSIRHTEMDVEVDGAWLRNTDVSRIRPAGDTDELVYATSRRQLEILAEDEPVTIFMYQTGLETAVVGFYRALVDHLLDRPRSVAVVPMYFRRERQARRSVAGSAQESTFAEGTPWVM
jgi:hypothetical protein